MRGNLWVVIVLLVAIVGLAGYLFVSSQQKDSADVSSAPAAVVSQEDTANPPEVAKRLKLIFFKNPDGQPCIAQEAILTGMRYAIEKRAEVVSYATTVDADREHFYRFGIRSLPAIVIVDEAGKEVHRFPPGIQDGGTILQTLRELTGS